MLRPHWHYNGINLFVCIIIVIIVIVLDFIISVEIDLA